MEGGAAEVGWLRHITGWPFGVDRPRRLGVAVSGGSDSMALLDLMAWHGAELGFEVSVVTVDHGLRPEAKAEADMVAEVCKMRGLRHRVLSWDGWDGRGNLQASARRARYALVSDWALRNGIDWVALGHTQDDQAETVLMRLARRSGVDGLAGMPERFEREGVTFIRPLLRTAREDLRAYLRERGIGWCEDPSNEDDSFERVRARKAAGILAGLGIDADVLGDVASNARSAKWALEHYLRKEVLESGLVREDRGDLILPERTPVPRREVPGEIHRRALNAAFRWIAGGAYPPRASGLAGMSAAMSGADRHTLAGCLILRQKGEKRYLNDLRITREFNAVRGVVAPTDRIWDGRWRLDGPHAPDLEIRALGETVAETPWRETGMPRASLLASPAIWRKGTLIAAPVAGLANGWTADATGRGNFAEFLLSR